VRVPTVSLDAGKNENGRMRPFVLSETVKEGRVRVSEG
jgi:hypothetical protein